jgi:hypothetical protein
MGYFSVPGAAFTVNFRIFAYGGRLGFSLLIRIFDFTVPAFEFIDLKLIHRIFEIKIDGLANGASHCSRLPFVNG